MSQQPKFKSEPCPHCGTPRSVVNGAWLRERRKDAGLTLLEMARRCEVSAAYICDIEHNRRNCLPAMRDAYENIGSFGKVAKGTWASR
jgi:DNA-binding XRE family transcriptional regulator